MFETNRDWDWSDCPIRGAVPRSTVSYHREVDGTLIVEVRSPPVESDEKFEGALRVATEWKRGLNDGEQHG